MDTSASVGGHILVVEDEPSVRLLIERILQHRGYRVTLARDGKEGLEQFQRLAPELTAVLLDVTMPHYTGSELLPLLRAIRPDVPALILSGFSETEVRHNFANQPAIAFLAKPFLPVDLFRALQTVCVPTCAGSASR